MFSKISGMLGKAWDFGSSLMKPLKNKVANGWEMLKNGASKVGQFVSNNHEAIGSILSGVGNIIGNMKDSPIKQKLQQIEGGAQQANGIIQGGFSNLRPANTRRTPFSNGLSNRTNVQPQQNNQPQQFQGPTPQANNQRPQGFTVPKRNVI